MKDIFEVVEKGTIRCSCGGILSKKIQDSVWEDKARRKFAIQNVPVVYCSTCKDEFFYLQTQMTLSRIADEMRKRNLPFSIVYKKAKNILDRIEGEGEE